MLLWDDEEVGAWDWSFWKSTIEVGGFGEDEVTVDLVVEAEPAVFVDFGVVELGFAGFVVYGQPWAQEIYVSAVFDCLGGWFVFLKDDENVWLFAAGLGVFWMLNVINSAIFSLKVVVKVFNIGPSPIETRDKNGIFYYVFWILHSLILPESFLNFWYQSRSIFVSFFEIILDSLFFENIVVRVRLKICISDVIRNPGAHFLYWLNFYGLYVSRFTLLGFQAWPWHIRELDRSTQKLFPIQEWLDFHMRLHFTGRVYISGW